MGSSWRRLAEMLGSSAGTTGSWQRRFAEGVGSIGGVDITLGDKGSWARRIAEGAATPLAPDVGSWARRLGGDGPNGSWAKRLAEGSDEITALGGGGGAPVNPVTANREFETSGSPTSSQWDDISGNARHMTLTGTPTIQSGGVLLNGTSQYGKTAGFTFVAPETIYLLVKHVTWTANRYFLDGNTADVALLYQNTSSPNVRIYGGASQGALTPLALDTWAVVRVEFRTGAIGSLKINLGTPVVDTVGPGNLGGLTFGARGDGAAGFCNIEIRKGVAYSGLHDDPTSESIIQWLAALGGVSLGLFLMMDGGGFSFMDGSAFTFMGA